MDKTSDGRQERATQIVGVAIVIASMFMPGIKVLDDGSWNVLGGPQIGWHCALGALIAAIDLPQALSLASRDAHARQAELATIFTAMTGLVNPLLLASFFASYRWQRWIASVIGICLLAVWGAMNLSRYEPLAGQFVWIAGVLLVVGPSVLRIQTPSITQPL